MTVYETCLILHPETAEDDIENLNKKIEETIATHKGKIIKVDKWGKKKLQYSIKKQQKGFYCFLTFLGNNKILEELDRTVRFNDIVLRYQTVRIKDEQELKTDEDHQEPVGNTHETVSVEELSSDTSHPEGG